MRRQEWAADGINSVRRRGDRTRGTAATAVSRIRGVEAVIMAVALGSCAVLPGRIFAATLRRLLELIRIRKPPCRRVHRHARYLKRVPRILIAR